MVLFLFCCHGVVKDKQLIGTDAIRTKVPPSKLMWEITKYIPKSKTKKQRENMVNLVNSSQPKGGHSAT